MALLTINLDVTDKACLVIGGGKIACPKALRLLEAGAAVTVIAPQINAQLPGATLIHRQAQLSDLDGKFLAIFSTDDKAVNRQFWEEAQRRGILSMAVDDPQAADFFSPAILRRGDLEIAVSTRGMGPAYSVRVRDIIAETIDDAYATALSWYASFRDRLVGMPMKTRIGISRKVLAGNFAAFFREDRVADMEERAKTILKEWPH